MTPLTIRHKITCQNIDVPCSKCPDCRKRRINGWAFRLEQEMKTSKTAMFLTLTYSTEFIPINSNHQFTLDKHQVQCFIKRLRKINQDKIKYYLCGEYGSKTNRPHYHIILFNAQIETIQKEWKYGNVHYGELNMATITYTLKYLNKVIKTGTYENDTRQPEFQLMSKRLGISYLTKQKVQYHKNDLKNRFAIALEDGKKIAMPRYFKDKIYNDDEKIIISNHYALLNEQRNSEFKTNEQIHNKVQSDLHQFNMMLTKSEKNDKL